MKKEEYVEYLQENYNLTEKEAKKVAKHLSLDRVKELAKQSEGELEKDYVASDKDIANLVDQTESNENYQKANETIKLFKSELSLTVAPYKATNVLRMRLIESKRSK